MQRAGAAAGQRRYSLSEENIPFESPRRKVRGDPLVPRIAGLRLEELLGLRIAQPLAALLPYGCGIPLAGNRVRRTWLRHESLSFVTGHSRALLVLRHPCVCSIAVFQNGSDHARDFFTCKGRKNKAHLQAIYFNGHRCFQICHRYNSLLPRLTIKYQSAFVI